MRLALAALGAILLVPAIPLGLLALTTPVSLLGAVYVLGAWTLIGGLVAGRTRARLGRWLVGAGAAALLVAGGSRAVTGARGRTLSLFRGEGGAPLIDRLLPERDVAVTAARAVVFVGMLPAEDTRDLVPTLKRAFEEMDRAEGGYPSPVLTTSLGLQGPSAYDTLEVDARGDRREARAAVLFLHGFGGNFSLQCWNVAQAARAAGADTFCPSTRLLGDWWSEDGRATVGSALASLRARGYARVVLAGLSNGAVGASLLAPALRDRIAGLLLISGATDEAHEAGVPTLAIEGVGDTMMRPAVVRRYAARTGARYAEVPGTHFVLIEEPAAMRALIAGFLAGCPG